MRKLIAVRTSLLALGVLFAACPSHAAQEGVAPAHAGKVPGVVVYKNGKPAAGATVYLCKDWGVTKPLTLRTGKSGKFTFDRSNGLFGVFASAPNCAYAWNRDALPKSGQLKLTLSPGSRLKGKMVDEAGKPISGVKVKLERCYAHGNGPNLGIDVEIPTNLRTTTTGKTGAFVYDHIPSLKNEYLEVLFRIEKPGRAYIYYSPSKQEIVRGLRIVQPRACKIDGTLRLPGKTGVAPAGTQLLATVTYLGSSQYGIAAVGKNGEFRFKTLPHGNATVALQSPYPRQTEDGETQPEQPYPWTMQAERLTISPERTARLDIELLTGALITGKVLSKADGKPVRNAGLVITHSGRPDWHWADHALTDASGEFKFRVAPGNVSVFVWGIDWGGQYTRFDDTTPTSFVASDGQDKTDLVLNVDLSATDGRSKRH